MAGNKTEVPLSAFAGLPQLQNLSFTESNVRLDTLELKGSATQLQKLYIRGIKKDQVVELSRANHGVLVTNGRFSYIDGMAVESGD